MDLQTATELDLFAVIGTGKLLLMLNEARDLVCNIFPDIITSKLGQIKN